jgi:hypothetical protein
LSEVGGRVRARVGRPEVGYAARVADLWTTAFLPEGWGDFRALLDAIVCEGAALYRWEEWSHEDGARMRAAYVVRSVDGPTLEDIRHAALERARASGFRLTSLEEETARTVLESDETSALGITRGATLGIALAPFPRQVVLDLHDRMSARGAAQYPAIAELFRLVASAGAARFVRLHRWAELDIEEPDRFYPEASEIVCGGPYDGERLCAELARAGFFEDGDAWLREGNATRAEVRLRDGEVQASVVPSYLAG